MLNNIAFTLLVSTVAQILQETGSEEPEGSSSVKWRSQKITGVY